ncbi:MAG TPA: protein kinase [Polyangiaceae bacterium]|nr:protein kinase [Polyangiaceae bacterium]
MLADRFAIDRAIGSGGMGSVFLARDRRDGRPVAIKLMSAAGEDLTRFRREARVLAELSHPGIVRYVAHGEAGPERQPFLAMELLEGEDLRQRLKRQGLTIPEAFQLIQKVAEALAFAHGRGVIHRDIKPSNIFLVGGDPGRVKLLDFGVARAPLRSEQSTATGVVLGTAGYMAPEQVLGSRDTSPAADVFSLGCVLFECLAGRPLFGGSNSPALFAQAVLEQLPRPSSLRREVTAAMDQLVARLLAWNLEARPADARRVLELLSSLGPVPADSTPPPRISVSDTERRVVSVIFARQLAHEPRSAQLPADATQYSGGDRRAAEGERELASIRELARRFDARVSLLREAAAVSLVLSERETAMDHAAQTAACALALRRAHPGWFVAVGSERKEITSVGPTERLSSWAASVLESSRERLAAGQVPIDEMTAGLLGSRFVVLERAGRFLLEAEPDGIEIPRLLLGKPTQCVGREAELAHLGAILQSCIEHAEPRAVLVTAPPGLGKSRLAAEFVSRLRGRDVRCWVARADAFSAGSELTLAQKLVRHASGCRDTDERQLQRSKLRQQLAGKVPDNDLERLVDGLLEIVGLSADGRTTGSEKALPMIRSQLDAGPEPAQKLAFKAWLDALCREPLVIVLEDLHWGDQVTLSYLGEALRARTARPLMVLALSRPEVRERFPGLWTRGDLGSSLHELPLGGLARTACRRLVRSVLGDELSPELLERMVERSDGNAFYLEELIRHVSEGELQLPETVLAMAEVRLGALDADARRVLRAASVFGQSCSRGGVAALLGGAIDAGSWLEALADRELLVRQAQALRPEHVQYTFRHALLRDAAYATLPQHDRRDAHRRAGEWLESIGDKNASVLAHHFREAGDFAACARHELRAGDVATRLCSYPEARPHYEACLEALSGVPEASATLRQQVDALLRLIYTTLVADKAEQNFERAGRALNLLEAIAARGETTQEDELRRAHVNYFFGRIHFYRADTARAIEYYERAIAAGKATGDEQFSGLPSCLLGTALLIQGNAAAAEPLLAQAIDPVERMDEPFEWFRAVGYHGLCLVLMGRYAHGRRELQRILDKAGQVKQASLSCATHIMTGTTYLLAGDFSQAHSHLVQACALASATRDRLHLNLAWNGAAWVNGLLGQHQAARAARQQAMEIARAMGGRLLLDDWYGAAEAETELEAGAVEHALELARNAAQASARQGLLLSQGIAERVWGVALSRLGQDGPALEHLERSIAVLQSGGLAIQSTRTQLQQALLWKRQRQLTRAEQCYERTCNELEHYGCIYALADAIKRWDSA